MLGVKHASSKVALLLLQTSDLVFDDEYKLLQQQEVNLALLRLKNSDSNMLFGKHSNVTV